MSLSHWEEYLKSYKEQKRLEDYQKNRILAKPNTTKGILALHISILFVIILVGIIGLFSISSFEIWVNILILFTYIIFVFETYGRIVAIKFIECYQHYASEEKRRSCKCIPSCSEYAILCLKKYELVYALLKIRKRLFVTCQGFEYKIDNP